MKRLHVLGLTCVCLGIVAMLLFRANTHAIAASPSSCGAWNVVLSANNSSEDVFTGIATIAANDIWAVGDSVANKYGKTLIEHWEGTTWSIVPSPNVPGVSNYLSGVTAVSATNVWAVGLGVTVNDGYATLTEHWDGTTWSNVVSPNPGNGWLGNPTPGGNHFNAVASIPGSNYVWAVGEEDSTINQSQYIRGTLTAYYC